MCVRLQIFLRSKLAKSFVLPETEVTVYSGDMGDTRSLWRRGHAVEGVSRDGRTTSVCGPPARGRDDGGAVRGVRDFPADGPQDLSAVPADRRAGPDRSQSPTASPRESAADGRGEDDRQEQARVSELG